MSDPGTHPRTGSGEAAPARDLVTRRMARLAYLVEAGAPDIVVRNERRMVREAIGALMLAAATGRAPASRRKRPTVPPPATPFRAPSSAAAPA